MSFHSVRAVALAGLAIPASFAQKPVEPVSFAAPVRLKAGDDFLGEGRLYPSPVYHDMNGDGLDDIVVGDLRGRITFAPRLAGDEIAYGAEVVLQAVDGKDIDFHNW